MKAESRPAQPPPPPAGEAASPDGYPAELRFPAAAVVAVGTVMAVLDGTIANVALPTIARELHSTPAVSVWVINGFQVAVTAVLVPFAALGDSVGYVRVSRGGLAVFTLGSLLCALSHTMNELIAARALQGIGAAAVMCSTPSLYRMIFPNRMLGRAIGYSGLVVAASTAAGPTIGGSILAIAPWQWLFLVNVPLGVASLIASVRVFLKRRRPLLPYDVLGAILIAPVFALIFLAVDGFAHGGSRPLMALEAAIAAVCFVAYVMRSLRTRHPLVDLRIFTRPRLSLSAVTSFLSFTAQGLAFIALPFLVQSVMGYSPFISGLLFTTWPLATVVTAPMSGRLSERYPVGILGTVGMALMCCGLATFALLPAHPAPLDILWRGAICGAGFGFFQAPNNHDILSTVPRERSGNASAIISVMRLSGQSTGAALTAIVLASAGATLHAQGASALRAAVTTSFELATAMTALGIVVSAVRLRWR